MPITYVLPLKNDKGTLDDLTGYLRSLSAWVEQVIVVDGSPLGPYQKHGWQWRGLLTHLAPVDATTLNGKVAGVHTGISMAHNELVVIADDDVRWDLDGLGRVAAMLEAVDVVVPQNVFEPMTWHAVWDSARSLLNRSVGHDYPGTLAVRRSAFARMGGYSGEVLFENLELLRTVTASGGVVRQAPDLYVRRRPPTVRHFWSQRVRQAYDDFAQPARAAMSLAIVPSGVALWLEGAYGVLMALAVTIVTLAEVGRRRQGGARYWRPYVSMVAPLWVVERGVCIWLAYIALLAGGIRYSGTKLRVAAHSTKQLRDGSRGLDRPSLEGV